MKVSCKRCRLFGCGSMENKNCEVHSSIAEVLVNSILPTRILKSKDLSVNIIRVNEVYYTPSSQTKKDKGRGTYE